MLRHASLAGLLLLAAACSEPVSGTLRVGPVDDGRAFEVVFEPNAPDLEPGVVHLEFQAVGAKLVLQGTAAGSGGCLPLPSTRRLVVLTGDEGLPPGARIRVAAWQYEAPASSRSAEGQVAVPAPGSRCSGILIADATYTVPGAPDAGLPADAGLPGDAGAPDAAVDAGLPADAGAADALPADAGALDAGTSTAADAGT
jgi:hypothetical protein